MSEVFTLSEQDVTLDLSLPKIFNRTIHSVCEFDLVRITPRIQFAYNSVIMDSSTVVRNKVDLPGVLISQPASLANGLYDVCAKP